jgi:hypothetical protein
MSVLYCAGEQTNFPTAFCSLGTDLPVIFTNGRANFKRQSGKTLPSVCHSVFLPVTIGSQLYLYNFISQENWQKLYLKITLKTFFFLSEAFTVLKGF